MKSVQDLEASGDLDHGRRAVFFFFFRENAAMLFRCEVPEMISDPCRGFKYQKIKQSRVSSTEQDMIIRVSFLQSDWRIFNMIAEFLQFPISDSLVGLKWPQKIHNILYAINIISLLWSTEVASSYNLVLCSMFSLFLAVLSCGLCFTQLCCVCAGADLNCFNL